MEITKIYYLHKGDNIPFYIGKTSNKRRINGHRSKLKNQIVFLEYIDEINSLNKEDWKPLESYWIEQFKQWGFDLTNKNSGGGGPSFRTEDEKRRISKNNLGRIIPKEHREKLSLLLKGHKFNLGRIQTKETRDKISKANLGRIVSIETRIKQSISLNGRFHSKETKQKMSYSALGKSKSEQHKYNLKFKSEKGLNNIKKANSKTINQYDLNMNFIKTYPSITEANKFFKGDIYSCCAGRQKTACKFIWEYTNKNN